MATKISTDEYQAFMKTLQSRKASEKPKSKWKSQVPRTENSPDSNDLDNQVDPLQKRKALLLEVADSDSGFSNAMSSGASLPTAMSSGISLEHALPKNTPVQNDPGAQNSEETGRTALDEESMAAMEEREDPSRGLQQTGGGQREERGTEEEHLGRGGSEPDSRASLYIVTPSKLLAKVENRAASVNAGGVGSFESFTSPSVLMRTEIHERPHGRRSSDERGGVQSSEATEQLSQQLADVTARSKASSSIEPLSYEEQKMLERRSQLEYGTLSSEEDSPSQDGLPRRESDDHQDEDLHINQPSFFDYSTPSNLLLRREQRASAEAAAGVGSFESFTTPSELFMQKPHVESVSIEEKAPPPVEKQGFKSSTEHFNLGDSPSELLKLKTEMIVSQRIGSTKSLSKSLPCDKVKKEGLQSSTAIPSAEAITSSITAAVLSTFLDAQESPHSGRRGSKQHVLFKETGMLEDKVDAVVASSGSDISLIDEEPVQVDEEDVSSGSCDEGDLDRSRQDVQKADKMIHSHKMVYKAKSFPLMHVKREMLCCGNDPITCECTSQESVEKLVGFNVVDGDGVDEDAGGQWTDSLDDSHSWANATLRSLQLVLEGTGEDALREVEESRDAVDDSKEFSTQTEDTREESRDGVDDSKEFSMQTEDTREETDPWVLMEDKLDYTRKLLQFQKKAEEEKAHLVKMHRRTLNELTEQNQEANLRLQQQEDQIRTAKDLQARNMLLETDLATAVEDYAGLEQAHNLTLQAMDVMEDKIKSLTSDLEAYAGECSRLSEALSLHEPGLTPTSPTSGAPREHPHPPQTTAHAKIFIELDEDENKLTIDTQVDRSFLCGNDSTKTDEELQAVIENLTEYITNELLHNLLPLLYHHVPEPTNHQAPNPESTNQVVPYSATSCDPGAAVTITLGGEGDTRVRIQAEMDAGFLGHDKNQKEVDFITRRVVEYVRDHFLERILQKLFPDEDIGSKFSISSDIRSSSLHAVIPMGGRGVTVTEADTSETEQGMSRLAGQEVADGRRQLRELGRQLGEAEAEVNALRGIILKQELEKGKLVGKLERRSAQLKDVCGQFSESEKQWIDERSVLEGRVNEAGKILKESEVEKEGNDKRIQELESLLSGLNKDLEMARRELREERQRRNETEKKSQDLIIGIMKLTDENVALTGELQGVNVKMGELKEELDSSRRVQEGRQRMWKESEGAFQERVRELQEETGPSIKGMERVIADLKNENCHLQTYIETLTPPFKMTTPQTGHFVPMHQNAASRHPTDGITVSWDKYHGLIEDNRTLTSRVTNLEKEKTEQHLLAVENGRLQSEVNRLREEGVKSHILEETHQKLVMEATRLERGKEDLNSVILENQRLAARVSKLEKEKVDHLARGKELEKELQRFQAEMGDLKSSIAHLTGDLREALLQSRNLEHRLETDELKAEYRLETRIRDAEDIKKEKERAMLDKMSGLEARNRQLEGNVVVWNEALRKLEEEKSHLEASLAENNQKLMDCSEELRGKTEQLNVKQAQLTTASSLLEELKYEKGGLSTKLLDLHHNLIRAQAEAEKTKGQRDGEVRQLQLKITSLEEDLRCTRSSLAQAQDSLQKARSELEDAKEACRVEVNSLEQGKEVMIREMRGLEEKLKERGMRALMMTDAHLHRQEEISKLNNALTEQTSELRGVRSELVEKTEELHRQAEAASKLKADLTRLSQEKLTETEARMALEVEICKQNDELARLKGACEHLRGEGERLSNELTAANKEREASSSSLLQLQQQYQALYENHTRLDCKTETDRSFTSFLQEELGRTREVVDQLKDEARDLKTELENSERTIEEREDQLERSVCESQGEVAKLQTSLEETSTSHQALQQSSEDQAKRLAEEEQKVVTLTNELEQLQKEFLEERSALKKLAEGKERLQEQLNERIEKLYNQKNNLQDSLYRADMAAKVDQCKRDSLAKELTHLKKCFDRQMSESASAAENLTALQKEMDELREDNTELHDTVASLEGHCQELIKEVSEKRKEITDLNEQLSSSLNQSRGYQSKIEDLEGLIQRERALSESVKKVNKEKKKKWLLKNQLFSSKVKTQLELSEERIAHLEEELMRVNHENHLQSCEVAERSQVIQQLKESNASLEDSQSALLEELGRAKRQLNKERELVQSLSESLMKGNDSKSNLMQSSGPRGRSSYGEDDNLGTPDKKNMQEEMKTLEAEMKRNLKDEIRDHVKLITKQFIVPRKRELIEDIAAELSEMREQRHKDTKKIENISANLGALSTTLEERLTPQPVQGTRKRRLSTVSEMNEAIRKANVRSTSRAMMGLQPRANSTRFVEPETSSGFNNSSWLTGSTDVFFIPELPPSNNNKV